MLHYTKVSHLNNSLILIFTSYNATLFSTVIDLIDKFKATEVRVYMYVLSSLLVLDHATSILKSQLKNHHEHSPRVLANILCNHYHLLYNHLEEIVVRSIRIMILCTRIVHSPPSNQFKTKCETGGPFTLKLASRTLYIISSYFVLEQSDGKMNNAYCLVLEITTIFSCTFCLMNLASLQSIDHSIFVSKVTKGDLNFNYVCSVKLQSSSSNYNFTVLEPYVTT